MEWKSPPPCPSTVTVRRNPHRRARPTPSSVIPLREPISTQISSFPIQDILAVELPQNTKHPNNTDPSPIIPSENLKIYLRIRPLTIQKSNVTAKNLAETKNAWPKISKIKADSRTKVKKNTEICVRVNEDLHSVTVSTPQTLQETKRIKSEVYEGFSRVFSTEASQSDVYEELVKPLVDNFLKGKCGMLVAMGPSGSGKTHTVFGTARQPGMVPLALGRIFSENESSETHLSRVYYLSMLEISSEKGKGERMKDLLHDDGDLYMQQSVVKGLQEVVVCDAQQAESLVARGMLKRATATTNSNNQSSRSQCIINIRSASKNGDGDVDGNATSTMLTIVDLAGAEREKKTGNQGARLLESNFINNTSMVFSLCLRSLLEHQKNRNKPLQKHYKNSLLTKYMQDYLEGKKRMMLILTVKPGVEDYLNTSFLLRQASPFTKIKFKSLEEPLNLNFNKRLNQTLPRAEQLKRMKICHSEASLIDEGSIGRGFQMTPQGCKEIAETVEDIGDGNLTEIPVMSDSSIVLETRKILSPNRDHANHKADKNRQYQIMQGLSKALWTVLKQYKEKVEGLKIENCHLKDSIVNEKSRSSDLETEMTSEKKRLFDLEKELEQLKARCTSGKSLTNVEEKELKTQCTCIKASTEVLPVAFHDVSSNISQYQTAELQEVKAEVSSYYTKELEQKENEEKTDLSVQDASASFASSSDGLKDHYHLELEGLSESNGYDQDVKGFKDTDKGDVDSRSEDLSVSIKGYQHISCLEDMSAVDSQISNQSTSVCLYTSGNCEQDAAKDVEDEKKLESESETVSNRSSLLTSLECESVIDSPDYEDFIDVKGKLTHIQKSVTDEVDKIVSVSAYSSNSLHSSKSPQKDDICFHVEEEQPNNEEYKVNSEFPQKEFEQTKNEEKTDLSVRDASASFASSFNGLKEHYHQELEGLTESNGDDQDVKDFKNTDKGDVKSRSENLSVSTIDYQHFSCLEDMKAVDSQISCQSTSVCLNTSRNCEQDAAKNVGDEKKLEPESESGSNGSSLFTSLECESVNDSPDYEDLIDVEGKITQIQNSVTDEENKIDSVTARSPNSLHSSKCPQKDDMCIHVEEEQPSNKENKLDPRVTDLPKDGGDTKIKSQFVPTLSSPSNFQHPQKPKRRLLPASSVLLKDISIVDIKDDNEKPKGGRGGRIVAVEDKNRTKGSSSLLHLLKTKLSQ